MDKPGFYKANTVPNTLTSALSTAHSDEPSASAATITPDRVRAAFLHAWKRLQTICWGHDELKPLSKTYDDWNRTPLLTTAVDALIP